MKTFKRWLENHEITTCGKCLKPVYTWQRAHQYEYEMELGWSLATDHLHCPSKRLLKAILVILTFIAVVIAGGDPHCYFAKNGGCVTYGYGIEFYGSPGFFKEEV